MNDNIFVSSACFSDRSIAELLAVSSQCGISKLELGSTVQYCTTLIQDMRTAVAQDTHSFLIHNYFPPPLKPFVLNLASNDQAILAASREHCRTAIRLCAQIGAALFSVHAGFCFHAEPQHLGKQQISLKRFSMQEAYEIFVASIKSLNEFARELGVKLAVENNPVAAVNCEAGENNLYLGVTSGEFTCLLSDIDDSNFGILIDMGHLKVSAQSLEFSPFEFIADLQEHIFACHLSDNDGYADLHNAITAESWFWPALIELQKHKPQTVFILETRPQPPVAIMQQYQLMRRLLNNG